MALVRDEQGSTDSDAKSTTSFKRWRGKAKLVNNMRELDCSWSDGNQNGVL